MVKVIIPSCVEQNNILDDNIIKDICVCSFGDASYTVEHETRSSGRYIKLVKDKATHFVCLSANEIEYNGRNSFLLQFLATAFFRYLLDENENKKMEVYLLMQTEKAYSPYQKFIYRCCKTLQINLLNAEEMMLPFASFKEIKNARAQISDRNTGNHSSYFSDTGEFVEFFAKSFGANGKEAVFMAMVVKQLTDKKIVIYQVEDNKQQNLPQCDRNVLIANGFEFGENITSDEFEKVDLQSSEKDLRDQPAFRLNLFKKYGDKKCVLCDCDIESLIIASHIHRVTDIKNDVTLTDEEKKKQIIDGDNGLWLCANHDKLFEHGLIYFDDRNLFISNKLNLDQRNFVSESTKFSVDAMNYNDKMLEYLELHKNRAISKGN